MWSRLEKKSLCKVGLAKQHLRTIKRKTSVLFQSGSDWFAVNNLTHVAQRETGQQDLLSLIHKNLWACFSPDSFLDMELTRPLNKKKNAGCWPDYSSPWVYLPVLWLRQNNPPKKSLSQLKMLPFHQTVSNVVIISMKTAVSRCCGQL